jgi:hypothetical protein
MQSKESCKEYIEHIILEGTAEEKRYLFGFNKQSSNAEILKQFKLFATSQFIRYFKGTPAPFHDEMVMNMIRSYRGEKYIDLAFRGSAKTTLMKLFVTFVLLNDEDHANRYLKILSRDIKNPRQIVTDVYNLCLEVKNVYGDVFEKEGDKKREETMQSFTMKSGVKFSAGTVGQSQRGHAQDAYRPDWIWFDDIEDRESVSSTVITEGIISRVDEAITGLAKGGSYVVTGNYISEYGVIQWFLNKENIIKQIVPIMVDGIPTWSIYTVAEIEQLKKDSEDFFGEYMCDPARSEGKFFDLDMIEEDMKYCEEPIKTVGGVKYWNGYAPQARYGLGADTSEGIGRDSNAMAVFNYRTGDLEATYHSNEIKPELFAYEIARVGREFGECVAGPEINNMSGGIVITTLKNIYPDKKIFRHKDTSKIRETESAKYGWHTNRLTKPQAFLDFRKDYNDGLIHIFDIQVLKEMKSFTNLDLEEHPESHITRHFDLLMATVIAWSVKNFYEASDIATVSYPND